MIAMKILKTVLDTWGYRELFMWNKKITSYDEIQKFDVKKQRWASRTDTRTFKNEFAVSELVENELGPLGKWNYSETIYILNTVLSIYIYHGVPQKRDIVKFSPKKETLLAWNLLCFEIRKSGILTQKSDDLY